jgi:hypothetical protein
VAAADRVERIWLKFGNESGRWSVCTDASATPGHPVRRFEVLITWEVLEIYGGVDASGYPVVEPGGAVGPVAGV